MLINRISAHGITILRIWLGLMMVKHSSGVIWFGGLPEFSEWIGTIGIPFPEVMGPVSKFSEFVAGIFLVLGSFTRVGAGIITINLAVACIVVSKGAVLTSGELAFNYLLIAVAVFLFGPGKYSLDAIMFGRKKAK